MRAGGDGREILDGEEGEIQVGGRPGGVDDDCGQAEGGKEEDGVGGEVARVERRAMGFVDADFVLDGLVDAVPETVLLAGVIGKRPPLGNEPLRVSAWLAVEVSAEGPTTGKRIAPSPVDRSGLEVGGHEAVEEETGDRRQRGDEPVLERDGR